MKPSNNPWVNEYFEHHTNSDTPEPKETVKEIEFKETYKINTDENCNICVHRRLKIDSKPCAECARGIKNGFRKDLTY